MMFPEALRRLRPEERRVARWMLRAVWAEVCNSIDVPSVRWATNLLTQSPDAPMWIRPVIEKALHEHRYDRFYDVVLTGLMDDRVRGRISARWARAPWPMLNLFPSEYAMGAKPPEGSSSAT